MNVDLDGSPSEIEPLLLALNERFAALSRKQKFHDKEVASLKTQLDIEGRGFRSINQELGAKTAQWERDKGGYEALLAALKSSERQLQQEKQRLEAQINTLKGLERRVVCLIDGDGTIFSQELLALGEQGGHAAARELTKLILQYLKDNCPPPPSPPELSVYIYLNKRGLMDALGAAGYQNEKAKFDDFVAGFNQAGLRFMMVDVGAGKENADSKLRVFLQDSIRSPQTWKVFFGGSHDNGYVPDLQSLITDGLRDKLILLPGYTQIASKIEELHFPILAILGLFMPEKLQPIKTPQTRPTFLTALPIPSPGSPAQKLGDVSSRSSSTIAGVPGKHRPSFSGPKTNPQTQAGLSTPQQGLPSNGATQLANGANKSAKNKSNYVRECFAFHLSGSCPHGAQCLNAHSTNLSPKALRKLAAEAMTKTCTIMLKYGNCKFGATCIHSHKCPEGPACPNLKQNKCKFGPVGMH